MTDDAPQPAMLALPSLTHPLASLEALSHAHADDLAAAAGEADLWQRAWYTSVPEPDAVGAEIDRRLALHAACAMAPWAIVAGGRAVGMTTYMNVEPETPRLEIGSTWMAVSQQGTGVNAAIKLLMLERAFEVLECVAVEFRTHWHNRQSRDAIERLGAKQDGVLRNHQVYKGTLRDTVIYSIVAAEWPAVRRGLEARLAVRLGQRQERPGDADRAPGAI